MCPRMPRAIDAGSGFPSAANAGMSSKASESSEAVVTSAAPDASSRASGTRALARSGPRPRAKSSPRAGSSQIAAGRKAALVPSGHCGLQRPRLRPWSMSQARRSPPASTAQSLPLCGSKCSAWTCLAASATGKGASKAGRMREEAAGCQPCAEGSGTAATGNNSPSHPTARRHHSAVPSSSSSNKLATRLHCTMAPVSSFHASPSTGMVLCRASTLCAPWWRLPAGQTATPSEPSAASKQGMSNDVELSLVPLAPAAHMAVVPWGSCRRSSSSNCHVRGPDEEPAAAR
mmetsp:Transcript_76084/g.209918  ORF Transcript_76084/g.209918 Transcript_76084/m.209918 type:complete len:289 (-) Transcript_76084:1779-2645(-)